MAKKRRSRKGKRRGVSGLGASNKVCLVSSGPKKGKLKKGWRLAKGGRCVRARG